MTNEQTINAVLEGKLSITEIQDFSLRMAAMEALANSSEREITKTATFNADVDTRHVDNEVGYRRSLRKGNKWRNDDGSRRR